MESVGFAVDFATRSSFSLISCKFDLKMAVAGNATNIEGASNCRIRR